MNKYLLALFNCIELDEKEYWLLWDLDAKCWQDKHRLWSLSIGIPSILFWIIFVPLSTYLYLKKREQHLFEDNYLRKFRMIY